MSDGTHKTARTRRHARDETHETARTRRRAQDGTHKTSHARRHARDGKHEAARTRWHARDGTHETRHRGNGPKTAHESTSGQYQIYLFPCIQRTVQRRMRQRGFSKVGLLMQPLSSDGFFASTDEDKRTAENKNSATDFPQFVEPKTTSDDKPPKRKKTQTDAGKT